MSDNFDRLQKATFSLVDLWLQNFARNIPYVLEGKNIKELSVFENAPSKIDFTPKGKAIVIGKGPSVREKNHLKILNSSSYKDSIICTDIMLIEALKNGITPDKYSEYYVVTVDGDPEQAKFYDDPLVEKFSEKIKVKPPEIDSEPARRPRRMTARIGAIGTH